MKPNYSTLLLFAAASLFGTMPSHARVCKAVINSTPEWAQTTGHPAATNARAMAVSGGRVYITDNSTHQLLYTEGNGWNTISLPSGSATNFRIASDDNGSIIVPTSPNFTYSLDAYAMTFLVLDPGATNTTSGATITIPKGTVGSKGTDSQVRVEYISASGDLKSATGGYLYFYPLQGTNAGKLVRVKVANSAYSSAETFSGGIAPVAVQALAKGVKDADGNERVLIQTAGSYNSTALYSFNSDNTLKLEENAPYSSRLIAGTMVSNERGRFYVYPGYELNGWNVSNTTLNVKNTATGDINTVTVYSESYSAQTAGAGMWVDAKFDSTDPGKLYAYCYIPGVGAWKYLINVTEPTIEAPKATASVTVCDGNTETPGRQDVVISWDAVDGALTYRVERKLSTETEWSVIANNLTETTYTNTDIKQYTYLYRVIAINDEGESDSSAELTCEGAFIPHIPEWDDLRNYDGYAKTQALWNYSYGIKPQAYDVIRDGVVIAKDITVMNYIDTYIPAGSRSYEIASVYYTDAATKTRRPESARSEKKTITVTPRNQANELYGLTELYNYEITADSPFAQSDVLPNFTDQNLYRQATLYNGKWYVAKRKGVNDFTTDLDASKGGIICFDADAGSEAAMASSAKSIYEIKGNINVGIAVDDNGTFFIRDDDGEAATTSQWEYTHPLKKGRLLRFSQDSSGNFTKLEDKQIDLSGVVDGTNKITNRVDYYSMTGDVLNGSGKLYFSPHGTYPTYSDGKDAWVVDIANGAVTSSKCYNSHVDTKTGGMENFVFPLDQRSDIMHLVRSNAYFRFDPSNTANHARLYDTMSRINNAGGTSIWFNQDLLIITPQAASSKNIGDFFVAKGTPDPDKLAEGETKANNANDVIIESDKIIPIVAVTQSNNTSVTVENCNCMWFGLNPKYSEDGTAEYLDIYLYVPGVRFAKYRLYPYMNLSSPEVAMDVDIQYQTDTKGENIDITSFKGTASWALTESKGDVNLTTYNLKFMSMDNTVLDEHWFNADGKEIDSEGNELTSTNGITESGNIICTIDNLDSNEYQAQLTATFKSANDDRTWLSEPSVASDRTDYEAKAPNGTIQIVQEYDKNNYLKVWKDAEGNIYTNYRLDIDFNAPMFDDQGYPVTYYEVWYRKPNDLADTYPHQLKGFFLMNGSKVIKDQDIIPGTYDFDNDKAEVVSGEHDDVVCYYYHQPMIGGGGYPCDANEDPAKWLFVVRANYAARAANTAIAKSAQSVMEAKEGGTTGIGEISADASSTTVYPTLTNGPLTVKAGKPIESVAVYGVDGSLAVRFAGQGDMIQKVDLSNLQPGLYIVNVNGNSSHKIVKY